MSLFSTVSALWLIALLSIAPGTHLLRSRRYCDTCVFFHKYKLATKTSNKLKMKYLKIDFVKTNSSFLNRNWLEATVHHNFVTATSITQSKQFRNIYKSFAYMNSFKHHIRHRFVRANEWMYNPHCSQRTPYTVHLYGRRTMHSASCVLYIV